jgi:hypothetical protein
VRALKQVGVFLLGKALDDLRLGKRWRSRRLSFVADAADVMILWRGRDWPLLRGLCPKRRLRNKHRYEKKGRAQKKKALATQSLSDQLHVDLDARTSQPGSLLCR